MWNPEDIQPIEQEQQQSKLEMCVRVGVKLSALGFFTLQIHSPWAALLAVIWTQLVRSITTPNNNKVVYPECHLKLISI